MCDTPHAQLGLADCQYYWNRVDRMEAVRPYDTPSPYKLAEALAEEHALDMGQGEGERDAAEPPPSADDILDWQLEAFEAGGHEWWTVTSQDAVVAAVLYHYREEQN